MSLQSVFESLKGQKQAIRHYVNNKLAGTIKMEDNANPPFMMSS
jgi:hypothetical protein